MRRRPPRSTLFPYTTLFRSLTGRSAAATGARPANRSRASSTLRPSTSAMVRPSIRTARVASLKRAPWQVGHWTDRKSTRLNSSHVEISYAVFCLKKKKKTHTHPVHTLPFNAPTTTEIYTLSLHDALPISDGAQRRGVRGPAGEPLQGVVHAQAEHVRYGQAVDPDGQGSVVEAGAVAGRALDRSEEHTSELQSRRDLLCRLLLEKKKKNAYTPCSYSSF